LRLQVGVPRAGHPVAWAAVVRGGVPDCARPRRAHGPRPRRRMAR